MVTSEKSKKEAIQQQIRRQKEVAKISSQDQAKPLILMAIPLIIYVVGATYFYDKLQCPTAQDCTIWGSYFSRSALFWVSGFFLFITITIAVGKGVLKGEAKVARYLIPLVFLLFLAGNYISLQTYVKTNEQGLESKDFINGFGDIKPVKLTWSEIQNFGIETYKSDGKCKVNNVYLILKMVLKSNYPQQLITISPF